MEACASIEYSPSFQTCSLLGGGLQESTNDEGSDPFFMSKIPVNPFVRVSSTTKVCPDVNARLFEMTGIFNVEACESLCLSHSSQCGSISFNPAETRCSLYGGASFLQTRCNSFSEDDIVYISYLPYLVRDSVSYASLTPMTSFPTKAICVLGGTSITSYADVSSEAACANLCTEAPKVQECTAYLFDPAQKTCALMKDDFDVAQCESSTAVLGISYNRASFTQLEDKCLTDTTSTNLIITYFDIRDYPECSALCESTFECKAFKVVDSSCQLFQSPAVSSCVGSDLAIATFVLFSDKLYTFLGVEYCIASDTVIVELKHIELEACKQLCDVIGKCISFEHNVNGECVLYRSSDFFSCSHSQRDLYISSARLYNVDTPVSMAILPNTCLAFLGDDPGCSNGSCGLGDFCNENEDCKDPLECQAPSMATTELRTFFESTSTEYTPYFCVLPWSTADTDTDTDTDEIPLLTNETTTTSPTTTATADCVTSCLSNLACVAVYRQNEACVELTSEDLQRLEPSSSCPSGLGNLELQVKFKQNPYQKMEGACLVNPLDIGPFENTEFVDCMNICDSHAFCRHFTHSTITGTCEVYAAQKGGVKEDCERPEGVTAYLNSRSFMDVVEYFGIPERVFAKLQGLSYDECAATCSKIGQCNAFVSSRWESSCLLPRYCSLITC